MSVFGFPQMSTTTAKGKGRAIDIQPLTKQVGLSNTDDSQDSDSDLESIEDSTKEQTEKTIQEEEEVITLPDNALP